MLLFVVCAEIPENKSSPAYLAVQRCFRCLYSLLGYDEVQQRFTTMPSKIRSLHHSCYWLSGQLLNMGLILKPDFPHHSPQTSDIHRHAFASNMEAGGWCGNIYHNIPFKYRHSPLLRLNILSQFSCPPVKLSILQCSVCMSILCKADRADDKIKCLF